MAASDGRAAGAMGSATAALWPAVYMHWLYSASYRCYAAAADPWPAAALVALAPSCARWPIVIMKVGAS